MYCAHCGSTMNGARCPVCGRTNATRANGVPDSVTGLVLVGWWRRVGATLSDGLILALPSLMIVVAFASAKDLVFADLCIVIINGLYTIPLLSGANGQTIGNRVASSRVRNAADGQRVTVDQVVRRWAFMMFFSGIGVLGAFAAFIGVAVMLVDYLLPLVDPRRQTLHDKFAGTIVVLA